MSGAAEICALASKSWIVMGIQITPSKIFAAIAFFNLVVGGWQLFNSLQSMGVRLCGGTIYRHERPGPFWFLVGFNCLLFFSGVLLIYLPSWIG
jgi:hypothetical protein